LQSLSSLKKVVGSSGWSLGQLQNHLISVCGVAVEEDAINLRSIGSRDDDGGREGEESGDHGELHFDDIGSGRGLRDKMCLEKFVGDRSDLRCSGMVMLLDEGEIRW
jgi:hypothetical protein